MRFIHDQLRDVNGNVTHEIYSIRFNGVSLLLEFFTVAYLEMDLGISICLDTLWIDTPLVRIGWGLL